MQRSSIVFGNDGEQSEQWVSTNSKPDRGIICRRQLSDGHGLINELGLTLLLAFEVADETVAEWQAAAEV